MARRIKHRTPKQLALMWLWVDTVAKIVAEELAQQGDAVAGVREAGRRGLAKYKCLACEHEWEKRAEGGVLKWPEPLKHPHADKCSRCRSVYFRWINFER